VAVLVRKATEQEIAEYQKLNARSIPEGTFEWFFDEKTFCYLEQGEAKVDEDGVKTVIAAGDMVTFPQGLHCAWEVLSPVKAYSKHLD